MTPPPPSEPRPEPLSEPSPAHAPREWREATRAEALAMGFEAAGFTGAEPLDDATVRRWARWLDRGAAGSMTYLLRTRPRRTHPRDLLPDARSALVLLAGYHQGDHPECPPGAGKIARYAWGEDYHAVLRARLERLSDFIRAGAAARAWPEPVHFRAAVDSAPLDERALAARAGLGFFGKNTLLIRPGVGSWFLIAVLLSSVPFEPDAPTPGDLGEPRGQLWSCGSCRRCLDACSTGALTDAHKLDPQKCISYLTIESRGPIPEELAPKLEGWAFGCDACQEVCPFNASPPAARLEEFRADRGAGAIFAADRLAETPSGKSFGRRWAASPLSRAGLKGMRRNLEALAPRPAAGKDA